MKPPKEIIVECPACNEETEHEILGGRVEGKKKIVLRSTVRCSHCGRVHNVEIAEEKPIDIPLIISRMERTVRSTVKLYPSEEISVNDDIYHEGQRVLVTSVEISGSRRPSGRAADISTIWAKHYDKIWVRITLDSHGKSYSKKTLAVPEEEFEVGEIIDIEGKKAVITAIRTDRRTIDRGSETADKIVRVYAKGIRR